MTVELDVRQRMNLMAMLRTKTRGKFKDSGRRLGRDILKKIIVPDEEIERYEKRFADRVIQDVRAMREAPKLSVDLEKPEIRKIEEIINTWDDLGPDDDQWIDPLIEQFSKLEMTT